MAGRREHRPGQPGDPLAAFARADAQAQWRPDSAILAESRPARLVHASGMPDLDAVQARAVADPAWFWGVAVDDLGLTWQRPWDQVLDLRDGVERARWWTGGAFDHALASLAPWRARPTAPALTWEGDDGEVRELTGEALTRAVEAAADRLATHGIGAGTRVALFLPLLPETAITMLALGRLRAVFTPVFSGLAAPAVAARLEVFSATHLITADCALRRGKRVEMAAVAVEAVRDLPGVRRVLVVERTAGEGTRPSPEGSAGPRQVGWSPEGSSDRFARWSEPATDLQRRVLPPAERPVGPVNPETPYMVIYTSGTTGAPKGTVHVHGGFPVKAAQDLAHTFDLRAGDALCWITDLGWMMGPWAISGSLLLGARLVLFEGAPDHPDPGRVWSLVQRHGITHLGISPTLVRTLLVHGDAPVLDHDLGTLRVLGSTGEPWNEGPWQWLFRVAGGGRLPIVNYSGGTEIAGGILGATVLRPIRATSFNGPCVGMAADVVDADGNSLRDGVGELAIRSPWPGMTRGFWGGTEADAERYLDTYWRRLAGTWVHGDWASRDADGFWYLHGRSDDTLKIAGKRVGPAELETAAIRHPFVVEAAAIGVPDAVKGEAAVLLVVLRRGTAPDAEALRVEVSRLVTERVGKPLAPADVLAVPELPRTRSGKIMRRVARAAWLGLDPGDLTSLENPAAVSAIAALGAAGRG